MRISLCCLLCMLGVGVHASDITIMSLNVEFHWDHRTPHEGTVVKNPPTKGKYWSKTKAIADLIKNNSGDIVGLVEIEGEEVIRDLRNELGGSWAYAFKEGRDNNTGQDVGLLSRFPIDLKTVGNLDHKKYKAKLGSKYYRPSKVLTANVTVCARPTTVVVAHLISKRNKNDIKRSGQAKSMNLAISDLAEEDFIVMGDFNDLPSSKPVKRLTKGRVITAPPGAYSYIFKKKQLIDHIILSPSLEDEFLKAGGASSHRAFDMKNVSDHRAVMVNIHC